MMEGDKQSAKKDAQGQSQKKKKNPDESTE